jgi:hypothetical protein
MANRTPASCTTSRQPIQQHPGLECHARCARGGCSETLKEVKGGEVGFAPKIGRT